MERTLSLTEQDFQVLDQMFQAVLRAVDIKSAKVILALHTKIEGQLTAQVITPAPETPTPAA